jgi:acyl-coenzyme A thioesterase PaaI-like protein
MGESWRTRLMRWGFNFFPAYRGTGGRVTYIAADWTEIHVTVPLNWRTRNYVGTIFGGSMYGALDPMYMFMLIKILGPSYVVWDKAASIRFRRPGRERLYATFVVSEADVDEIKSAVAASGKYEKTYVVELKSSGGEVHAICEKVIHVSRRD